MANSNMSFHHVTGFTVDEPYKMENSSDHAQWITIKQADGSEVWITLFLETPKQEEDDAA